MTAMPGGRRRKYEREDDRRVRGCRSRPRIQLCTPATSAASAARANSQGAGHLRDLHASRTLALGAQPRLRHVHEAARAGDLVAGKRVTAHSRLAVLADVDARIREHERPVGARRPVLLVRGDQVQCGRDPRRSARATCRSARTTGSILRRVAARVAPRAAHAAPGAPRRAGSIVTRHSSARAATSPRTSRSAPPRAAARASSRSAHGTRSGPASRHTNLCCVHCGSSLAWRTVEKRRHSVRA